MDIVDVIFNSYDKNKKLTKGKVFPFICHCVVSYISAKDIYDYLIENEFKVTQRTVVSWRRSASVWLGLAQTGKGRMSESDARQMRDDWHAMYGYPTYQDFFQGWKPREVMHQMAGGFDGESIPQTPANSTQKRTHSKAILDQPAPTKRGGEIDDESTPAGNKKHLIQEIEFSNEEVNLDKFKTTSTKKNK